MERFAEEMAEEVGPEVLLVEYGSGSSIKTRLLLKELVDTVTYVPVDISRDHLQKSADDLSQAFPHLEVLPVCADFTQEFGLPTTFRPYSHIAVYFPGSTIGNFQPQVARSILSQITRLCGRDGGLLIGIDLQKDVTTLEAAYNDSQGVTAEFNLNLLTRINHELNADIEVENFEHQAIYDPKTNRIEVAVVSQCDQTVTIGDHSFQITDGEAICTEHSHKYSIEGFAELAEEVGFTLRRHWSDDEQRFAVLYLVCP